MWELSKKHCCASCRYSRKIESLVETSYGQGGAGLPSEDELFPLEDNCLCDYCLESLGEDCVQAVLVRPDGRCEAYDCDEELYYALHGMEAAEDDDVYGLHSPVQVFDAFVKGLDSMSVDSGNWGGH